MPCFRRLTPGSRAGKGPESRRWGQRTEEGKKARTVETSRNRLRPTGETEGLTRRGGGREKF